MDIVTNFFESTMLIERTVGVGVYTLALLFFYNKIQHANNPRTISKYLNIYLFVLCVMAFFYIPGETADLYRWRVLAEPWKKHTFYWFLSKRVLTSSTPIGYLFIYACQMTGINGLLPMVCAFGYFYNVFYILKCESNRNLRSSDSIAVALLFIMCSGRFLEVISGVRCMLAFSIIFRFIYDEMYKNKSIIRSLPFYIISVLLHTATIPLIAIRLFCSLFEKKRSVFRTIINIVLAIVVVLVGIRLGSDYIDAAFIKAENYIFKESYSYSWEYIIVSICLILIILSLWRLWKRYPESFLLDKNSIRLNIFLIVIELLTIRTYSIYHRFMSVSIVMSVPMMLTFLNCESQNNRLRSRQGIVVLSVFVLLLACVRGNLCGYKFFLLS